MKKREIIDIMYKSAQLFEQNLKNKNLLIIYGNVNLPKIIETRATDDNFLHLTGIENVNSSVTPAKFYKNILDKKISENDFEIKKDGTTELKLKVLPFLMDITKHAKMLGIYNYRRPKLKTDKLIGNITASLGFIKTGHYYSPNTVLNGDIRDDIEKSERVLAILSKDVKEKKYQTIESVAKKIDINLLLPKVAQSVLVDEALINLKQHIDTSLPSNEKTNIQPKDTYVSEKQL